MVQFKTKHNVNRSLVWTIQTFRRAKQSAILKGYAIKLIFLTSLVYSSDKKLLKKLQLDI